MLVIDRNDGRGISFPGGLAWPWENSEACARREVSEETGLEVTSAVQLFEYHSTAEIPVRVTVFAMEIAGELKDSWEGAPVWLPLSEIQARLLPSQKEIPERLQRG